MGIKQIKIGTKDFIGVYINGVKRDFFVGVSKVAEGEAGGGDTPVVPEDTKLVYNAADDTFTIKAGTYKDEGSGEDYVLAEDMVLISDGDGTYTDTSGNSYFSPVPQVSTQPASGIYASACWLTVMNFGEEVFYNIDTEAVSEGYDPSTDPRAAFQTFLGYVNYNFATNKTESVTSTLKYDVISP